MLPRILLGQRSSCSARDSLGMLQPWCVRGPPIWAFRVANAPVLSWSGRKQTSRGKPCKLVTRELPALGCDTLSGQVYLCFEWLRAALAAERTSSFVNTAKRNGCDSRK
jgi:hypothetical protein